MERDRVNNARAPTVDASREEDRQSNGINFTGINPRNQQQRPNGRSLFSLNSQRNSQQSNPMRSDRSNNAAPSRNGTQQLPSIPNIRFRSIQNQNPPSRSPFTDGEDSGHAEFHVRPSRHGASNRNTSVSSPSLPGAGPSGATAGSGNSGSGRRQNQTRHRLQPAGASITSSNSNNPNTSPRVNHRTGTSPRRRHRRINGSGANNSNSSGSNTMPASTSTAVPSHRPRGSLPQSQSRSDQQWRLSRFSDDSDEDVAFLMDTAPRMPTLHASEFMSPPHNLGSLRGYGSFRGTGSADQPLELLNDSDTTDDPSSVSRDEEMARRLQQEEWERATTPLDVGFSDPNRLHFLQAMHQALGSDDIPAPIHNSPRRSRRNRPRVQALPIFTGTTGGNPIQIPALLELLPPGLMQALLGQGQFPPDEDDYEALLEMEEQIGAVNRGMSQRDINKIPVQKHRRSPSASGAERAVTPSQDTSLSQCSICLSEFNVGDSKRILPCQHELHKDCIDQWLKTNATCPICRKDIREGSEDRV